MNKLFSNISFVGGIHGVGKSTICRGICSQLDIQYLSASQVLKWSDMNTDERNKNVQDISLTQDRLINGLLSIVKPNKHYLLDGHYCLFDKEGKVTQVPFETFIAINPQSLHLIIGDVQIIKHRIEYRDLRTYEYDKLKEMQDQEIAYSEELSKRLNIQLSIGRQGNYSEIFSALYKFRV